MSLYWKKISRERISWLNTHRCGPGECVGTSVVQWLIAVYLNPKLLGLNWAFCRSTLTKAHVPILKRLHMVRGSAVKSGGRNWHSAPHVSQGLSAATDDSQTEFEKLLFCRPLQCLSREKTVTDESLMIDSFYIYFFKVSSAIRCPWRKVLSYHLSDRSLDDHAFSFEGDLFLRIQASIGDSGSIALTFSINCKGKVSCLQKSKMFNAKRKVMLLWGVLFIACAGIVKGLPRYHHSQTSNLQDEVSPEVSHMNSMEPTASVISIDLLYMFKMYVKVWGKCSWRWCHKS